MLVWIGGLQVICCGSTNIIVNDTLLNKTRVQACFYRSKKDNSSTIPLEIPRKLEVCLMTFDYLVYRQKCINNLWIFIRKWRFVCRWTADDSFDKVSTEHFVNTSVIFIQTLWCLYFLCSNSYNKNKVIYKTVQKKLCLCLFNIPKTISLIMYSSRFMEKVSNIFIF